MRGKKQKTKSKRFYKKRKSHLTRQSWQCYKHFALHNIANFKLPSNAINIHIFAFSIYEYNISKLNPLAEVSQAPSVIAISVSSQDPTLGHLSFPIFSNLVYTL